MTADRRGAGRNAGRTVRAPRASAAPATARPRAARASSLPRPPAIRRLPLGSLRVFVAVGEHLSFTRGADALGVTASAASMQIQSLEDYLRLPLFRRNGRQVELTAEGAALLPKVRQALGQLESAVDEARADRGAGPLRVTMLTSFLNNWLLDRLPDFRTAHPQIDLQIHCSVEVVDFVQSGMHAAVRFGRGDWAGLAATKLFDDWLVPVGSPSLLDRLGRVRDADDLKRHRLLHTIGEPWSAWLLGDYADTDWPASGNAFDDSLAVVRAAEAGHGLALARWSLVASEVAAGRLAMASDRVVRHSRSYWFACPPQNLTLDKVARLREWLVAHAAAFPPPPSSCESPIAAGAHSQAPAAGRRRSR
jgi:LysR family transcriptional regulator, glycine cleavage system transcriptional activator